MALITCSECSKEISSDAAACPHCGKPMRSPAPAVQPAAESKKAPTQIGCLPTIIILVGFFAIIGQCSKEPPHAKTAEEIQRDEDFNLRVDAELAVKKLLKDPDSAEFRGMAVVRKDGKAMACGTVNAKNGFGGFTGFQRFVSNGNPGFTFTEENTEVFKIAWDKYCSTQ